MSMVAVKGEKVPKTGLAEDKHFIFLHAPSLTLFGSHKVYLVERTYCIKCTGGLKRSKRLQWRKTLLEPETKNTLYDLFDSLAHY